jgi:ribonucleoside-diphosphate reductase alpha chain
MCGEAYLQSAKLAESCPALASATTLTESVTREGGACPGFYVNREPFLDVIRMHRAEVNNIGRSKSSNEPFSVPQLDALIAASKDCWDGALAHGEKYGYRNSQVTVLAPTGTIGFMMDCDTTGIEPELALVKYKKLVGGGMIKIVNQTVPAALFKLGYSDDQVQSIVSYIDSTGTIEGAPAIKPEHLSVFDCSFKPAKGTRTIHYNGHIKMMAATQPFLSGAISKTVNLPTEATADDIAEVYVEAWRLGIKAVAIYRDGSKGVQVLNTSQDEAKKATPEAAALAASAERVLTSIAQGTAASFNDVQSLERALENKISSKLEVSAKAVADAARTFEIAIQNAVIGATVTAVPSVAEVASQDPNAPPRAVRHRLPEERASLTHKFSIAGHEGYITVGLYPTGEPGEIFIKMAKEGSTVSGLMDSFATAISLSLQHGVPLKVLCEKFAHTRFEPSGWTGNEHIGYAKSIMDYIFRWLQLRFLSGQQLDLFAGLGGPQTATASVPVLGTIGDASPISGEIAFGDMNLMASGHPVTGAGQTVLPGHAHVVATSGHAADAMRSMYDMGDAPSCHTCGAIMVRNGSCYRCMSCGSTSGCS